MTEAEVAAQFKGKSRSIWLACGRVSGLVVLDCDTDEAEEWWGSRISLETAKVKTAKGAHYYFAAEGEVKAWGEDGRFDVRAEGTGVIAPPSIHESGFAYAWERSPWEVSLLPLPDLLRVGGAKPRARGGSVSESTGDAPTDMLAHLLASPPDEGGRNVWLAKVAGAFALRTRDFLSFKMLVQNAADRLEPALPEAEVEKLQRSIWNAEQAKTNGDELPTAGTGWLGPGDKVTLCRTMTKGGESVDQWADASIKAIGVSVSESTRIYDVVLDGEKGRIEAQLESGTLADSRKLNAWLLGHGVHQFTPQGGPKHAAGTLLSKYLDSQNPPEFEMVNHLGWHPGTGAYITLSGRINSEGWSKHRGVKPSGKVRIGASKYHYGMGVEAEARRLLNEVLTFHEEEPVAVIGAWWAAVLLKAQLQERFKLFPILEIAASSESGKTTGFVPLICALGGATGGALTEVTVPAFRDALSSHEGIVRVDDKGDLSPIKDLLRTAPMGGSTVKKGGVNWSESVEVESHAAIMITGQGQGVGKEKALADRVVAVELGNPTKRVSRKDASKMQLVDVIAAERDLKVAGEGYAGTFLQKALEWWEQHEHEFTVGAGRLANKHAVLRVGAALLASLTGTETHRERLEERLRAEAGQDTLEDALTLDILPHVLLVTGQHEHPEAGRFEHDPPTPVIVTEHAGWGHEIWFSPKALEVWLERDLGRKWDPRLHSVEGIEQQARSLGLGGASGVGRKQFRVRKDGIATNSKLTFWSAKQHSKDILERLQGAEDQGELA